MSDPTAGERGECRCQPGERPHAPGAVGWCNHPEPTAANEPPSEAEYALMRLFDQAYHTAGNKEGRNKVIADWHAVKTELAREAAAATRARSEAWESAAELADTQIVLWSEVPGLHPVAPEPHPAEIAAGGARRTLVVLRSRMAEAFEDRADSLAPDTAGEGGS